MDSEEPCFFFFKIREVNTAHGQSFTMTTITTITTITAIINNNNITIAITGSTSRWQSHEWQQAPREGEQWPQIPCQGQNWHGKGAWAPWGPKGCSAALRFRAWRLSVQWTTSEASANFKST